jgi:DHA2 family methylenomycin A resistance protein-like MFS transporter
LFGSLVGRTDTFVTGAHASLAVSAGLLGLAGAIIWIGRR